jgi:glycosyltransferase involved in cell wall biosynthesis
MRVIQYGGHALPAVATPVGITDRVVSVGGTGYLPRSEGEWLEALRRLVLDPDAAASMGARALDRIRRYYSNDVSVGRWIEVLRAL